MKYALICKNEPREQGYRCADVVDSIPFEPAPDHMWVECPDDFKADSKWFDPSDNSYKDFPPSPEFTNSIGADGQPTTRGTQTI
jgi:hypothetical protein